MPKKEAKKEVAKTAEAKEEKKTDEVKTEETKSFGKWLVLTAVVVLVSGYFGYNYILKFSDEVKASITQEPAENVEVKPKSEIAYIDDKEEAILEIKDSETEELKQGTKESEEIGLEKVQEEAEEEIVEISDEDLAQTKILSEQYAIDIAFMRGMKAQILQLEENNKNMVLYFAARDFRESLDDKEKFDNQLKFLTKIAQDYPAISGKLDILRHSSADSLPTKDSVINELKKLAKEIEDSKDKTVWKSVSESVSGLVKVTKIDGEISDKDNSTYAIAKRAEIAIEKENFDEAIKLVKKLGEASDEWVKAASNLRRIYEISDNLIEFSKNKIAQK